MAFRARPALAFLLLVPGVAGAVNITVAPGDTAALVAAINQANASPETDQITLSPGVYAIPASLPSINAGGVEIVGNGAILSATGSGYPLVEIGGGTLRLLNTTVRNFRNDQAGGAISVGGSGVFFARNSLFLNNSAVGDGGAINVAGEGAVLVGTSVFSGNSATGGGGAISSTSSLSGNLGFAVFVDGARFESNSAGLFGCALNLAGLGRSRVHGSQFEAAPGCQAIAEAPSSQVLLRGNTLIAPQPVDFVHSTAPPFQLANNVFAFNAPRAQSAAKAICSDFGSGALVSLGGNIAADASCALNGPGDLANGDAGLGPEEAGGFATLSAGSTAIERGTSTVAAFQGKPYLPCGYSDGRGLGRPQDYDGDGVFRCDSGAYEVQGGPNVGNAVSGAYFDTARNGEGTFIENLGGGLAFVATFSYGPSGGLAWFVGIGRIVGNSVVVDEVLNPTGGVFGAGFNPANIVRGRVGSASFVFPTCDAGARPGQWAFQAAQGNAYEDLLAKAGRLTTIVPCSGTAGANAGRSGSFYSAARDGEGIFVQFLPDGRAVVIWYTFDPQGRQFWTISADATVNGNTVTANMVYPAQTTRFGSQFNPGQVQLAPWGTVTLNYTSCNAMTFAYNSSVAGFGAGQYNYTRLTTLAGTTCN